MLCLLRNLRMEVHKGLRLPRNLRMEVHKVLCLPRNLRMEVHKVLCLPRNLHFKKQLKPLITMEGRFRAWSDHDPRMTRDRLAHIIPQSLTGQLRSHPFHSIENNSISCVRYVSKTYFVLRLPRNLHMEVHNVLCLPRNLHMECHIHWS